MQQSVFQLNKMDCPAEEQLVRMKMAEMPAVRHMDFDLSSRRVRIVHEGEWQPLLSGLRELQLDESHISTEAATGAYKPDERHERKLLLYVLAINAFFFVVELIAGFLSHSMGLVADSLDMLADALVYFLSLMAVGATLSRKKRVAGISGYLQLALALMGFAEVVRRFLGYGEAPVSAVMILVSVFALAGNALCLAMLSKTASKEAHIQASRIFTSNDVIINCGVILAGVLVYFTGSRLPDLLIGAAVFVIVLKGALRILKLSR